MASNAPTPVEVILFDLGGVLIELTGVGTMMSWSKLEEDEIWPRWLASPAVRAFESGGSSPTEFADAMVIEFELSITPAEFMHAYINWPKGPFPGTSELLARLKDRYHLACLSNTNHLHWERFEKETDLLSSLHSHFASHQVGKMKPDPEIYEHAIEVLGCPAIRILFLDDNQINVDGAIHCGMQAMLTRGLTGVTQNLKHCGLM